MADQRVAQTVQMCQDAGVLLAVLGDGKLSIKGNRTAPVVTELKDLLQQDRAGVLAAIVELNSQRLTGKPSAASAFDPDGIVGKVVSDDEMYSIYLAAHNAGYRLTSEWLGDTLPCDHRVTSCCKS